MKYTKYLLIFIPIIIIGVLIYKTCKAFDNGIKDSFTALNNLLPSNDSLSKEDSAIFKGEFVSNIKVEAKWPTQNGRTFYRLKYLDTLPLLIYSLPLPEKHLSEVFVIKKGDCKLTKNISYYSNGSADFYELWYSAQKIKNYSNIHINFDGIEPAYVENTDSLFYVKFNCNKFSIKYDISAPDDLFLNQRTDNLCKSYLKIDYFTFVRSDKLFIAILLSQNASKENSNFDLRDIFSY